MLVLVNDRNTAGQLTPNDYFQFTQSRSRVFPVRTRQTFSWCRAARVSFRGRRGKYTKLVLILCNDGTRITTHRGRGCVIAREEMD